jgi:hypothetical protein
MGHKSGRSMTEHYSVPELNRMLEYSEIISQPPTRKMVLVETSKLAVLHKIETPKIKRD